MTIKNAYFNAQQDYINISLQELNAGYTLQNVLGVNIKQATVTPKQTAQNGDYDITLSHPIKD